jgi:oleate hydratase
MNISPDGKAYIIGSGIAGMAAAVFLIRDGGMKGSDIMILDQRAEGGGSFDGQGSAEEGYLCSGFRMFEKSIYQTTFDLLGLVSSPFNQGKTLKDDFFDFNRRLKVQAKARLMAEGKILNSQQMQLNRGDQWKLVNLLYVPEKFFGKKEIREYFSADFFKSNFWIEWATTFAFQPWHSLVEMRRYLCRAVHVAYQFDSMKCVLSTPYSEQDFFITPLSGWLKSQGVKFQQNSRVTDLEFANQTGKKTVTNIVVRSAAKTNIPVRPQDLVFLTNGSITADASAGSMDKPPAEVRGKSDAFQVWKKLAGKFDDLGNPEVFGNSTDKSKWESFTLTFRDPKFFKLLEKLTGNKPGTGVLTTFKDSNWLMTLAVPAQPYFVNQPADTFVCWGYGLFPDQPGNKVKKKMSECSGREILEELCFHLGFEKQAEAIIKSAVCIPVMMPYITSQFLPRTAQDRPKVVPDGSQNFACIGQFVEIPGEIVFTVECSVRSARTAVKQLLKLPVKIAPIRSGKYNPLTIYRSIRTILK